MDFQDKMKFVFLIFLVAFNSIYAQDKFENLDVFELQYARDPQVSPDGNYIVYVRTEMDIMKDGRSSSLWIINTDGSNHQKLTSSNNNESSPRWSPDGKRISFISSSDDEIVEYINGLEFGKLQKLSLK